MNNDFLNEFKFFKDNTKEYKEKYTDLIPITFLITVLLIMIGFMLVAYDILDIYYLVLFIIVSLIYFILTTLFFNYKNKRKNDFDYKIYKGSLKDLFQDINHPAITSRKEDLKIVFESRKGFSGWIVFEIYLDILNGDSIKKQKELEKEESIMHELNMIK